MAPIPALISPIVSLYIVSLSVPRRLEAPRFLSQAGASLAELLAAAPLASLARRGNYGVREAAMAAEGNIDWSECPLVSNTARFIGQAD
jgi:hypothetical protein